MPANSVIQLRRGTAAQWTSANPVLASGEPGYETDTGKEKRGDGTTAWTSLPYFAPGTGTFALATDLATETAARAGLPSGITATGRFDPARSIHNAKPSNLRKTRTAIGKARAGTGLAHIVCVGDSIAAGYPGHPNDSSFAFYLINSLAARGWPAIPGWVFAINGVNPATDLDTRWAWAGGFARFTGYRLFSYVSTTSGATATYTSTNAGTVVEYALSNGYGAHTYTVYAADGTTVLVGPTAVGAGGAAGQVTVITAGSGLANTVHKLVITTTSTTSTQVLAARVRGTSGLMITNAGSGGSVIADWDTTAGGGGALRLVNAALLSAAPASQAAPDLVLYEPQIINDEVGAQTASYIQAGNLRIVQQLQARGSEVVLVLPPTSNPTSISSSNFLTDRQAMFGISDTQSAPLVDIPDRFGDYTTANGLGLMWDNWHGTNALYLGMASAVEQILAP